MACYGQDFRAIRRWTLWELMTAWAMVPVLRRERLLDMATAARMARAEDRDWKRAIRDLEG